jgi:UDP:flavonoid glycosyltransferase YjiC (YdhE family)
VANEIYTTTRDGLAVLVSRQVADGVLQRAVTAAGLDPDVVDARAMSRLLRGRVRRTLERTLPRAGVRRQLAQLDARIARLDAAPPPPVVPSTPPAPPPGAPPPPPTRPTAEAPALPPEAMLERLGRLDAVRQWIWLPDGKRPVARGVGPEAERARQLLAPIVTVLGRSGAVRSVHVQHGHGHVLVGRAAGATFAVAADLDVNLGAVYATFRALKEEP